MRIRNSPFYSLFLLFLFISTFNIYAQECNIQFKHLTTNNGLSNNTVFSIFQDSDGFVWISTMYGVNKYDGYEFTHYFGKTSDSTTVSSGVISSVSKKTLQI